MAIRVCVWSTLAGCAPTICAPLLNHLHILSLPAYSYKESGGLMLFFRLERIAKGKESGT